MASVMTPGCLILCLLCTVTVCSASCTIGSGWRDLSMVERLLMADSVVYGKTKEHRSMPRKVGGQTFFMIDAVFEVFCIMNPTEDDIPEEIIIEGISPRSGCSATTGNMKLGEEAILAIKHTVGNRFQFHEVMPRLSASFPAVKSNFFSISNICNLQRWSPPTDARVNRCPVCGVSDFSSFVMDADDSTALAPCFQNGVMIGNGSNCNMFITQVPEKTTSCVPDSFSNMCTDIQTNAQSVTCECTADTNRRHMKFGDIDGASVNLPGMALLIVMAIGSALSSHL